MKKLKKYSVILTRDITESAFVEVYATSESDAEDRALDMQRDEELKWNVNEGNAPDDAHTNGAELVEENENE